MSYVVGFLGDDGHLGRTFHVNTMDEALLALEALRSEQQDVFRLPDDEEVQDDAQRLRAYFKLRSEQQDTFRLPDEEEMQDDAQRLRAYFKLRSEQQDVFRLPDDEEVQDDAQRLRAYFDDHCVLKTELGSYFIGSLENL